MLAARQILQTGCQLSGLEPFSCIADESACLLAGRSTAMVVEGWLVHRACSDPYWFVNAGAPCQQGQVTQPLLKRCLNQLLLYNLSFAAV